MNEGFAQKRVYGRSSYYSITDKGRNALRSQRKGPQFDIDRMTQLVAKRLRDKGIIEKYSEVSNEQLMRAIRKKVKDFMQSVSEELQQDLRGGTQ